MARAERRRSVMERHLGLDLGATNIKAVLLRTGDGPPEAETLSSTPTQGQDGHDAVIARLVDLVHDIGRRHGRLDGVGIGTPGLFDDDGVATIFTNLPGQWRGVRLLDRMEAGTGLPVTLINDARAFTLAEGTLGAGRGHRFVACMTLGTGVGGGLMIDGDPFFGATGIAGEVGHQTVAPDGPMCGCGNRGCAEALARADVLCAAAGRASVEDVFAGAAAGDDACTRAIGMAADALGIALANVMTVVGPEVIVVGGGVAAGAGEAILDPIRTAVKERATLLPSDEVRIVPAALGPEAGAIGAALASARRQSAASETDQPPS